MKNKIEIGTEVTIHGITVRAYKWGDIHKCDHDCVFEKMCARGSRKSNNMPLHELCMAHLNGGESVYFRKIRKSREL